MRACELDELCVAGVYGAEGGGAHNKARAVDEELFGAGYGFIPIGSKARSATHSAARSRASSQSMSPSCRTPA